jgi:hypothetical protein
MARNKMTDVATMVMEEWHRPSSEDWLTAVCVAEEIQHPCAMALHHTAVWHSHAEVTFAINLYELTASLHHSMMGKDWTNGNLGNCVRMWHKIELVGEELILSWKFQAS